MSERVKWINHEGHRILSADYSGLHEADYIKTMDEVKQLLLKEPLNSIILVMANVTNTHLPARYGIRARRSPRLWANSKDRLMPFSASQAL